MKETLVKQAYEVAKQRYAEIGVDTEKVLEQLQNFHLSLHCWQADDVKGFEVQAGAMSGGITGFFADLYGDEDRPIITIVEPNKADCIYRTAEANDGKLHFVTGDMDSIMAGLCCGEPCTIGWNVLRDHADNFVSVPDYVAAKGMRILGNPMAGDDRVVSGESGAATFGFVAELLTNASLDYMRKALKIDENSRILCFSTEGDTDKENYRRIVWDGTYPSF